MRLMPPVMNNSVISALKLTRYSKQHCNDTEALTQYLNELTVHREIAIIGLVEELYNRYLAAMQVNSLFSIYRLLDHLID